jgi:hypothetical protein
VTLPERIEHHGRQQIDRSDQQRAANRVVRHHDIYMDASLLQGIFQLCSDEESRSSISGLACSIAAGPDEIR